MLLVGGQGPEQVTYKAYIDNIKATTARIRNITRQWQKRRAWSSTPSYLRG